MTDSTPGTPWLRQQQDALRLSNTDIERLHQAGFSERDDFDNCTADQVMKDTSGAAAGPISRPVINRVLKAAGVLDVKPAASVPMQVVLTKPGVGNDIRDALAQLVGPGKLSAITTLREHAVSHVVVAGDGSVDIDATLAYLVDIAQGEAHYSDTFFDDKRVAAVSDVGAPRLHHPRTGAALNKADPVGWHALTREQLIVAATIYLEGLDAGDSERMVFLMVRTDDPVAVQAKRRIGASVDLSLRAQSRIDGVNATGTRGVSSSADASFGLRSPAAGDSPRSRYGQHYDMLVGMFSADELRRYAGHTVAGVRDHLPGPTATLADVTSSLINFLEQRGITNGSTWWTNLVAERPRLAAQITTVAALYGVNL